MKLRDAASSQRITQITLRVLRPIANVTLVKLASVHLADALVVVDNMSVSSVKDLVKPSKQTNANAVTIVQSMEPRLNVRRDHEMSCCVYP